jgi:hypothetical protein
MRLRGLWQIVASWLFIIGYGVFSSVVMVLTLGTPFALAVAAAAAVLGSDDAAVGGDYL